MLPYHHDNKLYIRCVEEEMSKPLLGRSYHYPHTDEQRALTSCIKRFNWGTKYSHHRKSIVFFWLFNSDIIRPEPSSYCFIGLKILSTIKPDPLCL